MFLAVGVLGFVPGITTHYDQLTFAGHHSDAALLAIFNVSVLHNLVHLAFGVAGIALARKPILIGRLGAEPDTNARRASADLAAQYATRPATRCWIRNGRGFQRNPPATWMVRVAPTAGRLQ